jgi:N-methylhydantoinase B/oxoprolinase/acetone carboxylase alpha subunit
MGDFMQSFIELLKKSNMILEGNEMLDSMKQDDSKEKQIAVIFANAMNVALAQTENILGDQFASISECEAFIKAVMNMLKSKQHSTWTSALRQFERVGGEKVTKRFRQKLAK